MTTLPEIKEEHEHDQRVLDNGYSLCHKATLIHLDRATLINLLKQCLPYVQHDNLCEIHCLISNCTCGLNELMKQLEGEDKTGKYHSSVEQSSLLTEEQREHLEDRLKQLEGVDENSKCHSCGQKLFLEGCGNPNCNNWCESSSLTAAQIKQLEGEDEQD